MATKVKIAIIDSGMDSSHTFLNDKVSWGCTIQPDLEVIEDKYEDIQGHGTSVVSVIVKENQNVEIYPIKIFDSNGQTSLLVLEKALIVASSLNVDIVNLSLSIIDKFKSSDLEKICQKISSEGKIIISSQSNSNRKTYPAYFKSCIGVRGHILESHYSYWFNQYKGVQVVVDSEPFLHATLDGKYCMFGKSNSYAAAKFTGILSKIIEKNDTKDIKQIYEILKKGASKRWWTKYQYRHSYRFPEFETFEKKLSNQEIVAPIERILLDYLKLNDKKILYCHSLFSQENGLRYDQCFELLLQLKSYFKLTIIDYSEISRKDFYSFSNLLAMIKQYL